MADKKIVQVDQTGPIYAFLDTNAFYDARFSYDNGGMLNRMMSYSKDEKLIILYSSIVKREAFSYVETGLSEFARQAKNQIKNNNAIKAAPKKLINEIIETILGIPAEAKSFLERFLKQQPRFQIRKYRPIFYSISILRRKHRSKTKRKTSFPMRQSPTDLKTMQAIIPTYRYMLCRMTRDFKNQLSTSTTLLFFRNQEICSTLFRNAIPTTKKSSTVSANHSPTLNKI